MLSKKIIQDTYKFFLNFNVINIFDMELNKNIIQKKL